MNIKTYIKTYACNTYTMEKINYHLTMSIYIQYSLSNLDPSFSLNKAPSFSINIK